MAIRKIAEANTRSGELVGMTRVECPPGVADKVTIVHIEGNAQVTAEHWNVFKENIDTLIKETSE